MHTVFERQMSKLVILVHAFFFFKTLSLVSVSIKKKSNAKLALFFFLKNCIDQLHFLCDYYFWKLLLYAYKY